MKSMLATAIVAASIACNSPHPSSTPAPQSTKPLPEASKAATPAKSDSSRDLFIPVTGVGVSFSPKRGDAALKAFLPDVAADITAGECNLMRTGGSGATIVIAYFPTRTHAQTQMSMSFDSAGHLVRFNERRGVPKIPPTTGMTVAQRDSTIRVNNDAIRSTTISLDYAVDQAMVMNRGADRPWMAVMGTVREVESLEQLGPPKSHVERARRLCGV